MTPEQWQRAKALFEEALEQPEEERAVFVTRSCTDDPLLREETVRLLAEHASTPTNFLDPPGRDTLLRRAAETLAVQSAGYEGQLLGGRYLVEKEIGRGGSGVAYLAHDRQLHSRPVVLKFLHAAWEEHDRIHLRFRQEIEVLSRLSHPAVVGVLDVGHTREGRSFLVMEYVAGVTLRSRLQQEAVPFAEAASIIGTVCDALEAAHRNGIVHRDIKPENIILLPHGEKMPAKLIDFGIAKVQMSGYDIKTETVAIVGTVNYVAPEQLMGKACPQSDVYALGVVSYEMLTGRRPFEPETPFQLYELQKAGKAAPPWNLGRGIPRGAWNAIRRALSFNPEDRQSSPQDFAAEFQSLRSGRPSKPAFRFATVAAALALLLTAAGWLLWDRGWGPYNPVIEYIAPQNPEDFGFRSRLEVTERAVRNRDLTGFDAIRLLTTDQGMYYHKLSRAQSYEAMRKGWKLEATMQAIEGDANTSLMFPPAHRRFDMSVMREPNGRQAAVLLTQIGNGLDGLRYELPGPADAWHDYQLIFDPQTRSARLLIDGVERLSGYRGHAEFVEEWGLFLATSIYQSKNAEARFKRVRFEINR